jgi:hypothetical protein
LAKFLTQFYPNKSQIIYSYTKPSVVRIRKEVVFAGFKVPS